MMLKNNTRLVYLLQETVLFLGLSVLLILNSSTNDFVNADLQRSLAVILTLAVTAWVIAGQRGRQPAGRALVVWVLLYLVVLAFSLDPRRSASQMLLMSISVLLFSLSADLAARGWPRELVVKTLLMVGFVVILLGLLEAGLWYARWLQTAPGRWIPDVLYRPGSANVIAMFLNLMIMLAGARLLASRGWMGRVVLLLLLIPALFLLYLTSSRGGWLGTVAGLMVLAGLALYTGLVDWRGAWGYLWSRKVLLFGVLAILLLVGGTGGWVLFERTLHPTHAPVSSARVDYWPPAWEAFLKSPLVGTGQFTFSNAFISHNSAPPWVLYIHSHGTPFNLLAEMGLAGAVGMVFLVGTTLVGLWQQLKRVEGADQGVVLGALAAVAAVAVHSIFDCFHTEPIGLWTLCIVLGASLGQPGGERPRFGRFQNIWAFLVVLGLWGEIWMTAPLSSGVSLANSNQWEPAGQVFDQAVRRDPASVIAWQQRALTNSVLAARDAPGALNQAITDLEQVVALEPGWALNYANLGALYLTQNRPVEAVATLEEALRRAPRCSLCALNLGIAREASGAAFEAVDAYRLALDLGQPAAAYFWRSTPLRRQAQTAWLADHPQPLVSEEMLREALQANTSDASGYLALAAWDLQANQLDEAQQLLALAALAYQSGPETGLEHDWLMADLLARQGQLEQAVRQGEAVLARYRMVGLYGPGSFGQLYYAPLMFRRPAMALELTPQLARIEMPDVWGQRMAMLAGWADQIGDADRAGQLRDELSQLIPDFGRN